MIRAGGAEIVEPCRGLRREVLRGTGFEYEQEEARVGVPPVSVTRGTHGLGAEEEDLMEAALEVVQIGGCTRVESLEGAVLEIGDEVIRAEAVETVEAWAIPVMAQKMHAPVLVAACVHSKRRNVRALWEARAAHDDVR